MSLFRPSSFPRSSDMVMLTDNAELENWIINAFNGEWLKTAHAVAVGKRGHHL